MYEEHISIEVSTDMSNLVRAIVESNELYENILDKGYITRYDAERLKMNAYTIQEMPQKYGSLAYKFKRINSDEFHNETAEQAAEIAYFFSEMNKRKIIDKDNVDEVILELNKNMKEKIIYLKELNSLWVDSVKSKVPGITNDDEEIDLNNLGIHNQYGDKSLSHNFWVNLVIDIDEDTRNFLSDNRWIAIKDILQK